jgi:hypothetical protein
MEEMRHAILRDSFPAFKERFLARYRPTDERLRGEQKQKWLRRRGILGVGEGPGV